MQSAKSSFTQGIGTVTTDAVHRRFLNKTNPSSVEKESSEGNEYYYCKPCNHKMSVTPGKEELKFHFENTNHRPVANCVYCSKPVFDYKYKNKLELYHKCRYD